MPILMATGCLAIAACGSSKSGSGTTGAHKPAGVSVAAFDVQLGSVCRQANKSFEAAHGPKAQVAVIAHYMSMFRSVKPPSQYQTLYNRYLAVLGQELTALKKGNRTQFSKLIQNKAGPLVEIMGATGCRS